MKRRDVDTYFKSVKGDLEGKLTKASELLTSIEQKLNETETNRQQSAKTLTSLSENYTNAIKLINETQADLSKVAELRTIAMDPNTGIESLIAKINNVFTQAEELKSKISGYDEETQAKAEKVKENEKVSSKKLSDIEKLNTQAETLLKDLEKTYQLAINTGLAGSFDNRKLQVQKEFVNSWSKKFTISVIALCLLAALILGFTYMFNGFTLEPLIFFRLGLLSPVVFYVGYSAVQYGKERSLLEKYAFKATVAASLESYTTILSNNFNKKDNEKEILKFVIDSMTAIYKEPHEEIKKRSYGFSFGNNLGQVKSEIVEELREGFEGVKKVLEEKK